VAQLKSGVRWAMQQHASLPTQPRQPRSSMPSPPRWLVQLLSWKPVESGTFRVNKVRKGAEIAVECGADDEHILPAHLSITKKNREYTLNSISTTVDIHTRVSDLYSNPYDQIREQLRLTVEKVKERQEGELINNADYGLLHQATSNSASRRARALPRRTIWMTCWLRSGRNRPSSSHTHAPLPLLAGSAHGAASLRRRPPSSDRLSLPGAACRCADGQNSR